MTSPTAEAAAAPVMINFNIVVVVIIIVVALYATVTSVQLCSVLCAKRSSLQSAALAACCVDNLLLSLCVYLCLYASRRVQQLKPLLLLLRRQRGTVPSRLAAHCVDICAVV